MARSAGQQAILSNREAGYALGSHAVGRDSTDSRELVRDNWAGRQRRTYERFERQSGTELVGWVGVRTFAVWR